MNILFLIGNGFDLNVGLNTRFKDVLKSYLKESSEDPRIQKFKKDIDKDFENWADFEKQMGVYTENFTVETIDDYCFCMKNFKESLVEHFEKEEKKIDYKVKEEEIARIFKDSITMFHDKLTNNSRNILYTRTFGMQLSYSFITFNYTNVLDKCIEISGTNVSRVLHIHGYVLKNPIMGVDNVNQIMNKELSSNNKINRTIVKPIINKKLKNLNDTAALNQIYGSSIICLFGLSLGETDKTWWEAIGKWLVDHDSRQLVIFNMANEWNPIHPDEEIERNEAVEERFCLLAGLPEQEREYVTNRIHIGFNTDMFRVNLASPNMDATKAMKMITEAK